jgi:hypothetical protein
MNSSYRRTPRFTSTGIVTASILLVTLVMAASLLLDLPAADPSNTTTVVQASGHVRS